MLRSPNLTPGGRLRRFWQPDGPPHAISGLPKVERGAARRRPCVVPIHATLMLVHAWLGEKLGVALSPPQQPPCCVLASIMTLA
jgi:hypothetical protein